METVKIVFDAIDNTQAAVDSVMGGLQNVAKTIGSFDRALNIIGSIVNQIDRIADAIRKANQEKLSAGGTPAEMANARALEQAYQQSNAALEQMKAQLLTDITPALTNMVLLARDFWKAELDGYRAWQGIGAMLEHNAKVAAEINRLTAEAGGFRPGSVISPDQSQQIKQQAEYNVQLQETADIANQQVVPGLHRMTEAHDAMVKALEAAETAENKNFYSGVIALQGAFDSLKAAQQNYIKSMDNLDAQLKNGEISIQEYNKRVGEIRGAFDDAKQGSKQWAISFVADLAMARAAADGFISDPELKAILGFMESSGAIDPGSAELFAGMMAKIAEGDYQGATDMFNAAANAYAAVPAGGLPMPKFDWGTPIGGNQKKGFVYSQETSDDYDLYNNDPAAWLLKHGYDPVAYGYPPAGGSTGGATSAPTNAPLSPDERRSPVLPATSKDATKAGTDLFKAIAGVTPEQAAILQKIFDGVNLMNPDNLANAQSLFSSITSVNADELDKALQDVKALVAYDNKTITIYVNQVTTSSDSSGGTPTSGSSPTPTSGTTNNFYGPVTLPSFGTTSEMLAGLMG